MLKVREGQLEEIKQEEPIKGRIKLEEEKGGARIARSIKKCRWKIKARGYKCSK